jgi:acetyltransferase-like isoleucine patch superfamily enzyme
MTFLQLCYRVIAPNKPAPYYARYSILKILWIPIRKHFNVFVIPNTPFNFLRILLYRMIGYKIGKKVFIGMRCYLDDLEPGNIKIHNNVVISYGVYFALHGKNQGHTHIHIMSNAYIGMAARLIGRKEGLVIGEDAIVAAGSVVIKDVPPGETHAGNPAKKIN